MLYNYIKFMNFKYGLIRFVGNNIKMIVFEMNLLKKGKNVVEIGFNGFLVVSREFLGY